MTSIELTGLKGHHPLGFLAACGLLWCCHRENDFGQVKLSWSARQTGGPFTAVLHCDIEVNTEMIAKMLSFSGQRQKWLEALTWSTKIDDCQKYRQSALYLVEHFGPYEAYDDLAIFAALASDIVTSDKGTLRSTLLDMTSGNQHLLKSILALPGERVNADSFTVKKVSEALFGPWLYEDHDHSLGWDPQTQRLHALRHKLPEKDKTNRSVRVALFLASQALSLFPCFAVGGRLYTTSFHRDEGDDWFAWPIWRDPISLDTLRSLLAHRFTAELKQRGVEVVYRCRRVRTGGSEGNYKVFSHAEEWSWSR